MKPGHQILFVTGPTGVGKSEVALELARKLGAVILVMDAMQVYRGANIGTSKPSEAEQREIPHGGVDLVDVGESFDVGAYLQHAHPFLEHYKQINKPVVIVGGTGLYYRALTRGFCEAPSASEELRRELSQLTLEQLHVRLRQVDPKIVPQIDLKNPRRVARAIEVMETTGMSLRDWQRSNTPPLVPEYRTFFVERGREELHERINRRVEAMFAAGWVDEVRQLLDKHAPETMLRFPAIGYPEIARWILKGGDLAAVQNSIAIATRQYAKRQLTWFRRESNLIPVKMVMNDLSTAVAERLL